MVTITFDHRDRSRATGVHDFIEQARPLLGEHNVVEGSLTLGDIHWVGAEDQNHYIEITRATDALESLRREHLQDQVARLIGERDLTGAGIYLYLVGQINPDDTGYCLYNNDNGVGVFEPYPIAYSRWSAYLDSLQEMGITVREMSASSFGRTFAATFKRTLKRTHHQPARRKTYVIDPRVQALQSLLRERTRLSTPAAEALVEKFGSIRTILTQPTASLAGVHGIGSATATAIYEMGLEDKALAKNSSVPTFG